MEGKIIELIWPVDILSYVTNKTFKWGFFIWTLIASETRDFDQSFIIAHFREIYVSDEMFDKAIFKPGNFLLICHLYA